MESASDHPLVVWIERLFPAWRSVSVCGTRTRSRFKTELRADAWLASLRVGALNPVARVTIATRLPGLAGPGLTVRHRRQWSIRRWIGAPAQV